MAPTPDPRQTAPATDEAAAAPRRGSLAAGWAKFSDNAIPSLVVAIIASLVMFSLNQTNDRITRVDDRITRVEDRIARLEANIDARFTKLEENQQQIALTLATMAGEFAAFQDDVDARFAAADARFDAIETRLAKLEDSQREIASTLARLVALLE